MAESQPRAAGALGPRGEKGPGPAESHPWLLGLPPRPRPADKGRNDGAGGGGGGRAGPARAAGGRRGNAAVLTSQPRTGRTWGPGVRDLVRVAPGEGESTAAQDLERA